MTYELCVIRSNSQQQVDPKRKKKCSFIHFIVIYCKMDNTDSFEDTLSLQKCFMHAVWNSKIYNMKFLLVQRSYNLFGFEF